MELIEILCWQKQLFAGCGDQFFCQWSHHCIVVKIPKGAAYLASHGMTDYAVFRYGSFIGLQWHPELVTLKEDGYGVGIIRSIAETKKKIMTTNGIVSNEGSFAVFLQKRIQQLNLFWF